MTVGPSSTAAPIEGRVWVIGDSVDTDALYPGFAMRLPAREAARHVLHQRRPGWTDEVRSGDILIAGRNLGVGSSRPVAVLLRILGIAAVVADDFNSLFYRNCINYGLAALPVPGVSAAFGDGDVARVDLVAGTCTNLTSGVIATGHPLPQLLVDILDAGGLLPRLVADGYLAPD